MKPLHNVRAILVSESLYGRAETPVLVLGEMDRCYLVRLLETTKLPGLGKGVHQVFPAGREMRVRKGQGGAHSLKNYP